VHKHLSYTTVCTETNAFACLSTASSKGSATHDGDNELAIHFIVITGETALTGRWTISGRLVFSLLKMILRIVVYDIDVSD